MASINRKPVTHTRTHEQGKAVQRTPKQEMFLLCVSFLNEDSFYESADNTRTRLNELAVKTCTDYEWCLNLVTWLRGEAGLRTSAQITAATIVHARLAKGLNGHNREIIRASIRRPDEAPALLNYWMTTFGCLAKPVKRGVADALECLSEKTWLKYAGKTNKGNVTIADAIRLTHAKPKDARQNALFQLITRKQTDETRETLYKQLPVITARNQFNQLTREQKISELTNTNIIKQAALTHETIFSQLGTSAFLDATQIWLKLIPNMGYQATLMNLKRIYEDCINDSTPIDLACEKIRHPENAGYSPLPISFLSAYRNAPEYTHPALEEAARYTLKNVPELAGQTLIMLDQSGSMSAFLSQRSTLSRYDVASMFACALALKNPNATIIPFTQTPLEPILVEGNNPLAMMSRFDSPDGGTRVGYSTLTAFNSGHYDRVIVITDEQTSWGDTVTLKDSVPADIPLYVWNLGGYHAALSLGDRNRVMLGGLSDAAFTLLDALETTGWPWNVVK